MSITETLLAGQVTRYHANPFLNRVNQTNGDHTWGVMALLWHLFRDRLDDYSATMTRALFHDVGEKRAGDLPFPAKSREPKMAEMHASFETDCRLRILGLSKEEQLSVYDRDALKFCDKLESLLFIAQFSHSRSAEDFDGVEPAIVLLSSMVGDLDVWEQVELEINPFLRKKLDTCITPF